MPERLVEPCILFQSAPGGEAGGNPSVSALQGVGRFQSAPGGEAGGNGGHSEGLVESFRFNPPPAVRPGETVHTPADRNLPNRFQSAPGGEAGGN